MKVDKHKLALAMARRCMNSSDLSEVSKLPRATVNNAIVGRSIRPATLGKIAQALECDPEDIIQREK